MPDEGDYVAPPPGGYAVHVHVADEGKVTISEQSARFLVLALDSVVFKGSEAKMSAAVAQTELVKELARLYPEPAPNRAERRAGAP